MVDLDPLESLDPQLSNHSLPIGWLQIRGISCNGMDIYLASNGFEAIGFRHAIWLKHTSWLTYRKGITYPNLTAGVEAIDNIRRQVKLSRMVLADMEDLLEKPDPNLSNPNFGRF